MLDYNSISDPNKREREICVFFFFFIKVLLIVAIIFAKSLIIQLTLFNIFNRDIYDSNITPNYYFL